MKLLKQMLATALLAGMTVSVALAPSASANDLRVNLLLMVQDDDTDAVPERRQRIMSRVRQSINTSLNAYGYNMYDSAVVSQNFLLPSNRRKARQTLIEIARAVTQPPLDAALVMKMYASAEQGTYSNIFRLNIRVEGDVLNVSSGQIIGGFETAALEKPVLPTNCDIDCILEEVGKHSRVLGQDLARAIDVQIKGYLKSGGVSSAQPIQRIAKIPMQAQSNPRPVAPAAPLSNQCEGFPQSYAITFLGFENNEQAVIEEFLDSFSCKFQMRNLPSSASKIGFWYETSAKDNVLRRNLRTMLDYMDVQGQINFVGTQIEVTKILSR